MRLIKFRGGSQLDLRLTLGERHVVMERLLLKVVGALCDILERAAAGNATLRLTIPV